MSNQLHAAAADVLWTLMKNVDTNVAAIQSFLVTAKADGTWPQISNLIGEKIEAEKKLKSGSK